jgi:hypothetical protein
LWRATGSGSPCWSSPWRSSLGLVWELVEWRGMKGIEVEEFPL